MTTTSLTTGAIARHQSRRTQSVPTISALVGPLGLCLRAWRDWACVNHRPVVVGNTTDAKTFLLDWVVAAFATAPLTNRACAWLAAITGRTQEAVTAEVSRMTRYDLDVLRKALPINASEPGATAALLVLADRASGIDTDTARFVRELGDPIRTVRAVAGLYPPGIWPALLLVLPTGAGAESHLSAARALERIAVTEPRLPVALALTADEFAALGARYPDVRAVALLREGFVEVRGVSGNELGASLRAAGIEPAPAAVERLSADGVAEEVASAFVAANRAVRNPTPEDIESDFRSVHEAFLFEQLESMPQTAGLFRPNHQLNFRHGHTTAEGDLVAEALNLAIEVDGGFYHLNPDQYRRDRRKDWLYQRNGYLVLRFLAEDVVRELELVLDTILEAVAHRRASTRPTGAA